MNYLAYDLLWLTLPFFFHGYYIDLGICIFLLDHQGMSHTLLTRSVKQKHSQARGILTLMSLS